MGLQMCLGLGALLSAIAAMLVWAWAGPFAGAMVTGGAFYIGAMVCIVLQNQGRT
jgi:hypothetical protein